MADFLFLRITGSVTGDGPDWVGSEHGDPGRATTYVDLAGHRIMSSPDYGGPPTPLGTLVTMDGSNVRDNATATCCRSGESLRSWNGTAGLVLLRRENVTIRFNGTREGARLLANGHELDAGEAMAIPVDFHVLMPAGSGPFSAQHEAAWFHYRGQFTVTNLGVWPATAFQVYTDTDGPGQGSVPAVWWYPGD